jgi:hypothetical protein
MECTLLRRPRAYLLLFSSVAFLYRIVTSRGANTTDLIGSQGTFLDLSEPMQQERTVVVSRSYSFPSVSVLVDQGTIPLSRELLYHSTF